MYRIILIITIFGSLISCKINFNSSTDLQPKSLKRPYISYYLPKSTFKIDLIIKEKNYIPGPFAKYSEEFLNIKQTRLNPKTEYSIQSIQINNITSPDSTKEFILYNLKKGISIQLTDDGILTGINSNNNLYNHRLINENLLENEFYSEQRILVTTENFKKITDTIHKLYLENGFINKKIEVLNNYISKTEKDQAKEIAQEIIEIRNKRSEILSLKKKRNYDGQSLKIILNQLDTKEKELLNLFTGISYYKYSNKTYFIEPKKGVDNYFVTNFSNEHGISTLSRDKIILTLNKITTNSNLKKVNCINDSLNTSKYFLNYNKPLYTEINIVFKGENLLTQNELIPNIGFICKLNSNKINSKSIIRLSPKTGDIEYFKE